MSSYEENLASQLAMLDPLWQAFVDRGVTDTTELVLEFLYVAPGRSEAEALREQLRDYDTEVRSEGLLRRRWFVEGKSPPTLVSKDVLQQWLEFMVATGWDHACEFDGFGASIPTAG